MNTCLPYRLFGETYRFLLIGLALTCAAQHSLAIPGSAPLPNTSQRQAEIAARSPQVMPFELSKTMHVFTKTKLGGVQQVIVKDPSDSQQLALIRQHLLELAGQFGAGNFNGPTHLHGADMPGLAELKSAKPKAITVTYHELSNGAELIYSSRKANLQQALHQWFDAQLADHGDDATSSAQHKHHH